jgi:DNA repair protein RecO (recombination protein O)
MPAASYDSFMALARDRCICLRKVEYSETSQIVTLFSREHGLLRLIAKGAHRRTKAGAGKFDGGLDLLDIGDAVFAHAPERELSTLTEWHLKEGHRELHFNLRAMYLGLYAAELVSMLIEEHDPHPHLFDRVEQTLVMLPSSRIEEVFLVFQLDLLREAGYLPHLEACVICGRPMDDRGVAYFSPGRGGLVCRNCEATTPDRNELDARLVRLLRQLDHARTGTGSIDRLPRLTRHQTDPLNRMLAGHIEHTLSRRLRMPAYVITRSQPIILRQ